MTFASSELAPGYSIPKLVKGCWHLAGGHGAVDVESAILDMATFAEAGFTCLDCADHYTGVEELIGRFRKQYPTLARSLKVHTKCVPDYDRMASCDKAYITSIVDRSLLRLGCEQLDMVQFHWWSYAQNGYLEAMAALDDLRLDGKISKLGLTNFDTLRTQEILKTGIPIVSTQVQYSLIDTRPENSLISLCTEYGVQLLCYGTLAGGLLSETFLGMPEPSEPFSNRSHTKYKLIIEDFGGWELFQHLLLTLKTIAIQHGVGLGEVATRWVIDRPQVAAAIVGFTSTRHLAASRQLLDLQLSAKDSSAITEVIAQRHGPQGDCYDLERDKAGRHGSIMRYNLNVGRH
jgi:aryl-alcohol dehydrogenase-like predicted oxidoreductase